MIRLTSQLSRPALSRRNKRRLILHQHAPLASSSPNRIIMELIHVQHHRPHRPCRQRLFRLHNRRIRTVRVCGAQCGGAYASHSHKHDAADKDVVTTVTSTVGATSTAVKRHNAAHGAQPWRLTNAFERSPVLDTHFQNCTRGPMGGTDSNSPECKDHDIHSAFALRNMRQKTII